MSEAQSIISQNVASANSPVTITLRDANNEVPPEVSAYRIVKAVVTDQSAGQNDVTLQSYNGTGVDSEVVVALGANGTKEVAAGEDDDVLVVKSGNTIRAAIEGDADITLYITPVR